MSLPLPSKTDGILNVVSYPDMLYSAPKYEIRGWYRFCSGGVVAGISGRYRRHVRNNPTRRGTLDNALMHHVLPADPITSFAEYNRLRVDGLLNESHLDLPLDYLYDHILEAVFIKSVKGQGGIDMWAGNSYPSKTFVLGDRQRKEWTPSVRGFARYLERLQKQGVSRVVRLTDVPGAHGSVCTSWLVTLREDEAREYLEERLIRVNAHLNYLKEYKKAIAPQVELTQITENDLILSQW